MRQQSIITDNSPTVQIIPADVFAEILAAITANAARDLKQAKALNAERKRVRCASANMF